MSTKQLRLIDSRDVSWRLDEQTKAIGMQGIARARAALAAARLRKDPTVAEDRRHAA